MLILRPENHPQLFDLSQRLATWSGQTWLVGGTIRDLLLGNQPADYDIAFSGDLTATIRSWSKQLQGNWFWLDKERNQSRVLLDGGRLQFDFAPLRAATIEDDLRLRDFTLNAIALPLSQLTGATLIDPLDGITDLQKGQLRCCSEKVLEEDPLRCLKGVRHHAQHGWVFVPEAFTQLRAVAPLLNQVAGERLRMELALILAAPFLSSSMRILAETGLAQPLFSAFDERRFQDELLVAQKRLQTLSLFEIIRPLLAEEIESSLPLQSLLILALIFVCTTDFSPALVERLRLSGRSRKLVETLINAKPALIDFSDKESPRISALKVERLGNEPVARLLFTLMRRHEDASVALSVDAIAHYGEHLTNGRVPDLLGGTALIKAFPSLRGKEVGSWLVKIKTAEIKGEISSAHEAGAWLKQQFSD